MKTPRLAIAAMFLAASALAATIVTESDGPHVLHAPGGQTLTFPSHAECVAAAPIGRSTCSAVTNVDVAGVCDTPKPTVPEDQRELKAVQDLTRDYVWWNYERAFVAAPFPECWSLGWELKLNPSETG